MAVGPTFAQGSAGGQLASGGARAFPAAAQVEGQQQPETPQQSSWVPDWLRDAIRGKNEAGKGNDAADKLGGKAAGGGVTGFVVGKVVAPIVGPILSGLQHLPLVPYVAGGYGVYRLFLRPGSVGGPVLIRPAPFLLKPGLTAGTLKFFFSPPALIVTGIATLLRKYVLPKTPGENLLYPIIFGPTAFAGDELPSVDAIGQAISRLFRGSFFDFRVRPEDGTGGLLGGIFGLLPQLPGPAAQGEAGLIPQWQADP